jgi:hypothetical protein
MAQEQLMLLPDTRPGSRFRNVRTGVEIRVVQIDAGAVWCSGPTHQWAMPLDRLLDPKRYEREQ